MVHRATPASNLDSTDNVSILVSSAWVVASDAPASVRSRATLANAFYGNLVRVCDGTADDVDFQAVINALPSGGGRVVLSEGTFTIAAQITGVSGVSLSGQGRDATTLALADSADVTILDIQNLSNIVIEGIEFDGNKANQTSTSYCIMAEGASDFQIKGVRTKNAFTTGINLTNCDDYILDDVEVDSCGSSLGNGLTLAGGSRGRFSKVICDANLDAGFGDGSNTTDMTFVACEAKNATNGPGWTFHNNVTRVKLIGCQARGNSTNGFRFAQTTGSMEARDVRLVGCEAEGNTTVGFFSDYPVDLSDFGMTECVARANTQAGFAFTAGARFTNCEAVLNGQHGFDVTRKCHLHNCDAISNGTAAADTYRGIFIRDTNCSAYDCRGVDLQDTPTQRTGIEVAAAATDARIIGGEVSANTISQITLGNSSAVVRHVDGYVTENWGTGSVDNGATTDVVAHGLAATPTHVSVTLKEQGSNDPGRISWSADGTNITFTVSADPGASNLDFSWEAVVR